MCHKVSQNARCEIVTKIFFRSHVFFLEIFTSHQLLKLSKVQLESHRTTHIAFEQWENYDAKYVAGNLLETKLLNYRLNSDFSLNSNWISFFP